MAVTTAVASVLGTRVRRVDGPEKVTGQARFGDDLPLYGLLHARLVLESHAHARITSVDASRALAHPGVVAVLTADDLATILKSPRNSRARESLARGVTRFCGQPVAAVVAESEAAAEDALALVEVEYEELPAVLDPLAALRPMRLPSGRTASPAAKPSRTPRRSGPPVAQPCRLRQLRSRRHRRRLRGR